MATKTIAKEKKRSNPLSYQELLQRYRLFRDLMDNIPDVIYFKDKKGRLILVNRAHARGLNLRPEQVAGKTDFDFFPKIRAEKMAKDDELVINSGKPVIDKVERATRPDGVDNYVSTTKIPRYDERGRIIGLVGITRDITHRMQLEHLREEKAHILKKLQALEELNKMKSEFVSVVSHELRTPLAIIKEAVMLIFDEVAGSINDKQKGLLIKAKDNIARLKRIIDELLEISRIESGRFKLHYSLVNLNDLLMDSAEFFKNLADDKGVYLEYILPRQQINIFIDAERINQVVSNLINNAIKFTEENGRVKIEVRILENKVRVGVMDTGIGISRHDVEKLFNKFVQVSKISGAERQGLGLGLSIAKDIVEQHDGEIWVDSKLGVGSKFYFTLPRFYTTNILSDDIRKRINDLLYNGLTLYLINLLVINFKEFKKRTRFSCQRLFDDLKNIIDSNLRRAYYKGKYRPQLVIQDYRIGEYSIVFPEATENQANDLCGLLKSQIKDYFTKNKVEDIFINLGISSYPSRGPLTTSKQLLANLYLKYIYIGAEVRRFKRTNYKADIEVILPDSKTELSQTVDISAGGVCFLSKRRLETDAQIEVRLKLPREKEIASLKGRISWIKDIAESAKTKNYKYKMGLEFTKLNKRVKEVLAKTSAQNK